MITNVLNMLSFRFLRAGSYVRRNKKNHLYSGLLFVVLIAHLVALTGCRSYSTMAWPEPERTINAPIDRVWDTLKEVLIAEGVSIRTKSKESYFVLGVKGMSLYSNTDQIAVRLIKIDENKTLIRLEVDMPLQLVGWGHAEDLARELYNKLKDECEKGNRSNMPSVR
jgi:hypothetical protein